MISKNAGKKVLVALSGGVDSSVAALLLKTAGYQVEGAYMRCWSSGAYCTTDTDQADAIKVASKLEIPFHVFDYERQYKQKVIDYFFSEYARGRTPNPDVMCNKEIKFGLFLEEAQKRSFDYVATGHYARVHMFDRGSKMDDVNGHKSKIINHRSGDGLLTGLDHQKDQSLEKFRLFAGLDREKDQSYFLYKLGQKQLAKAIFPLGRLTKIEVRKLAKKFGLPTADKKDSTGICFVGPANIRELLLNKISSKEGEIVDVNGEVLGKHIGLPFYTIGQRGGLGISKNVPYYVAGKDETSNKLIVVPFGHKALFKKSFLAEKADWIDGRGPKLPQKLEVKLRYRANNVLATVKTTLPGRLLVSLEKPQRAITPGQAAVFYKGNELIGGATVTSVVD